jgi:regulatory protein
VGRRRRRIRLTLDDGTTLEVSPVVLRQHPVTEGEPLGEALRTTLLDADLHGRCREAGLRLLGVRARSRRELHTRLTDKGFPPRVVDRVLDDLEGDGWLDDDAFARALVRDRVRLKPRAPARLREELRRKGVARGVADAAIEAVFAEEEIAPLELAVRAARGWLRRQGPATVAALGAAEWSQAREKAKRRLANYLGRRGFRGSVAVTALEAIRETARSSGADGSEPADG